MHTFLSSSRKGFTLLEVMLVTTIFAIMSIVIMQVYIHMTTLGQRLSMSRLMADSARDITERIANDVRTRGVDTKESKEHNLIIRGNTTEYIFGYREKTAGISTILPCISDKKCSLFRATDKKYPEALNLVDIFVPDDGEKRVKIDALKFSISGDSDQGSMDEPKVTLIATLSLTEKSGVIQSLREDMKFTIQTTISERAYKSE